MGSIRHFVIQVRPDNKATLIGEVPDIDNAPATTDDCTVYVLKVYLFAGAEMWVVDYLGNWWKHPHGTPLTHWNRDNAE
jgi:hypothetical protein